MTGHLRDPFVLRLWLPPITEPIAIVPLTLAFLLAPIVVGAAGFVIFFIPVFAIIFGGIPYLVIGTPLLLLFAGRIKTDFTSYACLGLVGWLAALAIWYFGIVVQTFFVGGSFGRLPEMMPMYAIMGLIFAPLWAGCIAPLYKSFQSTSKHPNPYNQKGKSQ